MPDITALVVAWNGRADVESCLRGLFAEAAGPRPEVVVVDNGSTDGTAALVRERFPAARLVENGSNLGFAAAVNRALPDCRTPFVLLLNPDASPAPGCLEALRAFLAGRPAAWAAGPRILDARGRPRPPGFRFPRLQDALLEALFLDRLFAPDGGAAREPHRAGWLEGSCLLVRREAFDRVGPFDERFFLYYEEVDWLRRAAAAGGEAWWVPSAGAVHRGPGSPGHYDAHRLVHFHRSRVAYQAKHHGRASAAVLRALLALRAAGRIGAWSAAWLVAPRIRPRAASCLRGYGRVLGLLARGEGA